MPWDGYNVGEADGIFGPATQKGIRDFQYAHRHCQVNFLELLKPV